MPIVMEIPAALLLLLHVLLLLQQPNPLVTGQQPYINNKQNDCYNPAVANLTAGYTCNNNGAPSSCGSYVTFRSSLSYNSLASISELLSPQSNLSLISSLNNFTSVQPIPPETLIILPLDCSCTASSYYQHNSSYVLQSLSETYLLVANNTYQGLTTCQSLMAQNPFDSHNLSVGLNLTIPLRCACPTANQTSAGARYLLTYLVTWGDTVSAIAGMFGVTEQSVIDANELTSTGLIYPFTTILVPLPKEPTEKLIVSARASPSPPPPSIAQVPTTIGSSSSSKKGVFVGVGVGVGGLLTFVSVALCVWYFCHYSRKEEKKTLKLAGSDPPNKFSGTNTTSTHTAAGDYASLPGRDYSISVSSAGIRDAIETLTVYSFRDLQEATGFFSEECKIKGSVYRGRFKNDAAAVKVLKGDVSKEINILRQINHSNITRLSGFCVRDGNTYLVYEYAENGSLSDWLHLGKDRTSLALSWKQRVQIAYHVAEALNYLHNYTNPPYIHKNLKSSNVLIDSSFRAKITNFGLARIAEDSEEGGLQLTRHVVGTQGYMAPEYMEHGMITPKLDVFAFGVVMLELLSGREAVGDAKNGEELLSASIQEVLSGDNVREKLRDFVDPSLKNEYPLDLAFSLADLAKKCTASNLNSRPEMGDVFTTLSKIFSSTLDWDPSDEVDPSRSNSHGR